MAEMDSWHRGRLIDHIQLVVRDLGAARRFYGAALAALGVPVMDGDGYFYADELFVSTGEPLTGRAHLAFQAPDRETVQRFYDAALAAGGTDNGAPGLRPYHADYYAAFVLDPDGNNIEAVYHGPAERSAPSVEIRARS
ncbi:VOC family protein [Xanthobacter autotrophicus]|uniref:VOC family protein n=1 Tax=Xanthobacter autotrophicus TaxID=280 RepID=UPI001E446010|nr:VOC family protein [Xanthobacter autotrophicus]UDQ91324.1 VOC family protein [Xanthobacter autotrophicus]